MNRRMFLSALMVAISPLLFSQTSIYQGASESVLAVIKSSDQLIAKQAYESAFKALGPTNDDAYILAKKTEVCINYFVQSLNHKMFAFKDFAVGDTFTKLRTGSGTYNMYSFDPVDVIGKLVSSGNKNPILYKALGDYYYDVSLRFHGRWTESDVEIAKKAVDNYEVAYSNGFRDSSTLTNYADKATEIGNYFKAVELYKLALAGDQTLFNASFNIAYASLKLGNFQDALLYGEQAIEMYKSEPNYRMDAILLCSDAAYGLRDYSRALDYLTRALLISKVEYRVYQKQAYVNLAKGDLVAADQSLDQLFELAPTNPGVTQMVVKALEAFGKKNRVQLFFLRNIPRYGNLPEAQANLYFHQALDFETAGDKQRALETAGQAKSKFLEAGKYSEQIKSAIDALVARNG